MPQPGAEIELSVDATGWFEAMGGQAALERLVERAAREALSAGAAASGASVVVSVLLTNNARIAELNHAFRNKSAPTDVLSWPSVAWPRPATVADLEALGPEAPLGDLALALERVQADAISFARDLEHHVAHLIVHGVLHLLGYDHEDEGAALVMEAAEDRALRALGLPGRDE